MDILNVYFSKCCEDNSNYFKSVRYKDVHSENASLRWSVSTNEI